MANDILSPGGIYAIRNLLDGKIYIGSSVNFKKRWRKHRWELRKNIHRNGKLQNAWIKYGEVAFLFDVIEIVTNRECLILREQYWIDKFSSHSDGIGYNLLPIAGSCRNSKLSDEHKAKIGLANKGRKASIETRAKISASGRKRITTLETRKKQSAALKGRELSEEHKTNLSKAAFARYTERR